MLQQLILTRAATCLGILAVAVVGTAAAHATTIIDNFVTPFDVTGDGGWNGTNGTAVGPRSGVTTLTQTGIAGAIGDRTATFTGDQSGNGLEIVPGLTIDSAGNAVLDAGQGILTVNTQALSTVYDLILSYDVTDLDLSSESRFTFNLNGDLDPPRNPTATLPFDIELTSGASTDTTGVTLSADGSYVIPFSAYTGIDFSDIDGIRLLSSNGGVLSPDLVISAVLAVPEPATALLVAAGLALMACSSRRRLP